MSLNLVYDRTEEDETSAAAIRSAYQKLGNWSGLTDAERAQLERGALTYNTLNRVEQAVKTLAAALTSAGYPVEVTPVLKGASRLPTGYTEVEWIESSGTQYIDTGVSGGNSAAYEIVMNPLTASLSYEQYFAGDKNPVTPKIFREGTGTNMRFQGTTAFKANGLDSAFHDIEYSGGTVKIDGSTAGNTGAGGGWGTLTWWVFNAHGEPTLFSTMRLKSLKMWMNEILVRDFIPCKKPSGAVGLYDLVGGEFYTTPMAAEAVALPAGYTQVEYLQSSGTQYIDTGFKPNQDTRIVIDFTALTASVNAYAYGMRGDSAHNFNPRFGAVFKNASVRVDYGNDNGVTLPLTLTVGGHYKLDQNKNVCALNASTATNSTATFQCPNPAYLFAINEGGTAKYFATVKLYSGQVYDNGALIRNFVPARNASGTLGLYDTVNGAFYTNKGSGTFTAGADIVGFTAGADINPYEDREWQEGDVLYRPQWTTYLDNVQRLRDAYYTLAETGELPASGDKLNYTGANTIEKVLADIDLLLDGMKSSYRRCGTFRAGNNAAHLPLKGSI